MSRPTVIEQYTILIADRYLRGEKGAIAEAIAVVLFNTNIYRRPENVTEAAIAEAATWVSEQAAKIAVLAGNAKVKSGAA